MLVCSGVWGVNIGFWKRYFTEYASWLSWRVGGWPGEAGLMVAGLKLSVMLGYVRSALTPSFKIGVDDCSGGTTFELTT